MQQIELFPDLAILREGSVLTSGRTRASSVLSKELQKLSKQKKKGRSMLPVYATMLNIRPSYSTVYAERLDDPGRRTIKFERNKVNLRKNDHSGKISKKARLNIQCAIDWLVSAAGEKIIRRSQDGSMFKFKVNFITLTLPSSQFIECGNGERRLRHSDQVIKKECLAPFLDVLRKRYKCKNYVWRAETQVNGNIHFHLLTDVFIHYKKLRDVWNECTERLGYVSRFEAVHGSRDPNSTDVHSVMKIKKLGAYLSKYMAKDSKGRAVDGRQWFLSESLSGIGSLKMYFDEVREEVIDTMNSLPKKCEKVFDYCKVLLVDVWTLCKSVGGKIFSRVDEFLSKIKTEDEPLIYEL